MSSRARKAEKEARKLLRTQVERASEVRTLRGKVEKLGFPPHCPGMIELERLFKLYIEGGETVEASAPFLEWNRMADVRLPARRDEGAGINMRYVAPTEEAPALEAVT